MLVPTWEPVRAGSQRDWCAVAKSLSGDHGWTTGASRRATEPRPSARLALGACMIAIKPENNSCGADCLRAAGPLVLTLLLGLRCLAGEAMSSLANCLAKVTETGSESCSDRGTTPSPAPGTCAYRECNPQLRDSPSSPGRRLKKGQTPLHASTGGAASKARPWTRPSACRSADSRRGSGRVQWPPNQVKPCPSLMLWARASYWNMSSSAIPMSAASRMGISRNSSATAEKAMAGRQLCGSPVMAGDYSMCLVPRHASPDDLGTRDFDHAPAFPLPA